MNRKEVQLILEEHAAGSLSINDALESLATLPFRELADVVTDSHRELRTGLPEVVFAQGKTTDQMLVAVRSLHRNGNSNVLITRASQNHLEALQREFSEHHLLIDAVARCASLQPLRPPLKCRGAVVVICAGTSDTPVAREAAFTSMAFGNPTVEITDVGVAGIHRLIPHINTLRNACAVIAVAGMEGALPSVIAGLTPAPVIAVPTSVGYGTSFNGLTALLAMLNSCSPGITVVNIDNGFGAAYAASRINLIYKE